MTADAFAACTIVHVDMDAFFAAVEVLDDQSLAGRPLIVGGSGARGVVASCTYEARAYGIHSAMSSIEAHRRCPHAIFVDGRYGRYKEVSDMLMDVLRRFTPLVEPLSLDEAFLDVAGVRRSGGRAPLLLGRALRSAVRDGTGLECSVGVARTKMLAKLASEAAKPRAAPGGPQPGPGVVVVRPDAELDFLHPLPVRALWGVGPATAKRLEQLGVESVAQLAAIPVDTLCRSLGAAHGRQLAALARGEDDRHVDAGRPAKSVSHEETFAADLHDHGSLHVHLVRMADAVAARLCETGLAARTVQLKIRYADRRTVTRARQLSRATDSAHLLRAAAGELLDAIEVGEGVRLLGVSAFGLSAGAEPIQLSFDEEVPSRPVAEGASPQVTAHGARWEDVEAAVAAVRSRYGHGALSPATLAGRGGIQVRGRGDRQWGPGRAEDETVAPPDPASDGGRG
ncbi:MAG: DNA polymerase IV [Acidimicrobiales bacterium]